MPRTRDLPPLSAQRPRWPDQGGVLADIASVLGPRVGPISSSLRTPAAGDHQAVGQRYDVLLADLARLLGNDHWLTRRCSINLAEIKKHDGPPSSGDGPARTAWT